MKYAEALAKVVGKLEDSGYDSVEEWAESILKSLGIVKSNHEWRTSNRDARCSVCGKFYHEHCQ